MSDAFTTIPSFLLPGLLPDVANILELYSKARSSAEEEQEWNELLTGGLPIQGCPVETPFPGNLADLDEAA